MSMRFEHELSTLLVVRNIATAAGLGFNARDIIRAINYFHAAIHVFK
jgi:hypothetical protein